MVSFSCEVCNDTIVKKKLMQHRSACSGAYFTCLDCQTTFPGLDFQKHTSCISEAEKYQKSLYKAPAKKQKGANVTEKKKEEKDAKEIQVPAETSGDKVEASQKKESTTNGDKLETPSPKKAKKDKKDKKKEAVKEGSIAVTETEEAVDPSLDVNDKGDDEKVASTEDKALASPSESKEPETKANKQSQSDNNKRKRDETTELKTRSSEVNGTAGLNDEVATAGKKTKVEKPAVAASVANGKTKGKTKGQMPSDVVLSLIQSMVAQGEVVSIKTLIKRLKRNKVTHNITKAKLMERLALKKEGDKLILFIAS
ncbi:hypothetical protein V1525DRAFT_395483 [Lipomyces kononenkoae]|uniref:Uncharacterized protein n=1 Tax=Lipomyces kononenkoae TaxID=34357 RepID=A0ACC3T8M2_LIPKO